MKSVVMSVFFLAAMSTIEMASARGDEFSGTFPTMPTSSGLRRTGLRGSARFLACARSRRFDPRIVSIRS